MNKIYLCYLITRLNRFIYFKLQILQVLRSINKRKCLPLINCIYLICNVFNSSKWRHSRNTMNVKHILNRTLPSDFKIDVTSELFTWKKLFMNPKISKNYLDYLDTLVPVVWTLRKTKICKYNLNTIWLYFWRHK